jgi:hypothetical protein
LIAEHGARPRSARISAAITTGDRAETAKMEAQLSAGSLALESVGVDVAHLSIRPEVSVRFVLNDSDSYAVPMATIRAIYHFETHGMRR